MKVPIMKPTTVDIGASEVAYGVNKLIEDPETLSVFTDALNESVLSYITSYYIGKLKADHPSDFDKLARFMLGVKPEDEPVKKCSNNCTNNDKRGMNNRQWLESLSDKDFAKVVSFIDCFRMKDDVEFHCPYWNQKECPPNCDIALEQWLMEEHLNGRSKID